MSDKPKKEMIELLADKSPNPECAKSNMIYVNEEVFKEIPESKIVTIRSFIFFVGTYPTIPPGVVALNTEQRRLLNCSLQQKLTLKFKYTRYVCSEVEFEISFLSKSKARKITLDADQLRDHYKQNYLKLPLNICQKLMFNFNGDDYFIQIVSLKAGDIDSKTGEIVEVPQAPTAFYNTDFTKVIFKKEPSSTITIDDNSVSRPNKIFNLDFDFQNIGVGGLDKEFQNLIRRAFCSRIYPRKFCISRGIQYVKGILLYGPPGTGKTLLARQIGKVLGSVEPKIVNGPQILDKLVGESERKIRDLFADAEEDQRQNGDDAALHLIIFDEIDSLCKKRGGSGTMSAVQDTIVNQILSKMDGYEELNDILIIGMTNRKDLLDDAILRPGRFEVHLEISLPDEAGREQIFKIHTKKLKESNALADDVDLKELARLTTNFTGAEIASVIKNAVSFSMHSGIDPKTLQLKDIDLDSIKVTREDFMKGLSETIPHFGVEQNLYKLYPRGIALFSNDFKQTKNVIKDYIDSLNSTETSLMSFCISGVRGSGITSFAVSTAKEDFSFVKLIHPKDFIGKSEDQICNDILEVFLDAYKSKVAAIIIDDIDAIVQFSPIGPKFSNRILGTLLTLLKQAPVTSKLAIFATTSMRVQMEKIGITRDYFYEEIELKCITSPEELENISKDSCNVEIDFSGENKEEIKNYMESHNLPIKRLIECIDFASFKSKDEKLKWSDLFNAIKARIK